MNSPHDSPLDLPLSGVRRIEASAGTGKTFTLALLHARLVIERGLGVRQILAVTYTKAATQELRERLRKQLDRAARIAALLPHERTAIRHADDAADRLTVELIERQLEQEPVDALAARLRRAAGEIDLAAIFTIHGFCQRVLAEHAVDSGEPLLPREMIGSERSLHEEVAFDVWRRWTRSADDTRDLLALWRAPAALSWDLPALLRAELLLPASAPVDVDMEAQFMGAAGALRSAWQRDGADAQAHIAAAQAAKTFNGNKLRADTLKKNWLALAEFAATASSEAPDSDKLACLTPTGLRERVNTAKEAAVPESPLFNAIEDFLMAQAQITHQRAQRRANLLHAIRDYAQMRLAELKRSRNLLGYDDLIGGVHAALSGARGEGLAQALREQYPVALVDEFQDTDAHQWQIFRAIYVGADAATLFLIGDPKQAIYRFRGGDVHTYHAAARDVTSDHALAANYRSRPRVLAAIAALFDRGGEFPFADEATRFPAIQAGGRITDADFRIVASAAPALHLWRLPLRDGETTRVNRTATHAQIKVDAARSLAADATAARIQALLTDAHHTLRDDDTWRPVRPSDITVLVNTHREAEWVQRALAECGVSSVTARRSSLYATGEAAEILTLLDALHASGDESRLRAALATELVGMDAIAIDALSRDELGLRTWLDRFESWRQRWQRFGPLALVIEQVAAAAPRLLGRVDGERRLSNYLQLAEQLQEVRSATLAEAGLIDWLARRIADADEYDETQQLRLESDAERVQIMTLHKAKGLEFALVFLPFAALPPRAAASKCLGFLDYHDGERRVLHARIADLDDAAYAAATQIASREARAEQLRLLYVGLTRARHAVWLAHGAVNRVDTTALGWLLHRGDDGAVAPLGDDAIAAVLRALVATAPEAIVHEDFPQRATASVRVDDSDSGTAATFRTVRRDLRQDWWVHSFSQLAQQDAGAMVDERGADDEVASAFAGSPSPFAGARFGNALHAAIEKVDFSAWRDVEVDDIPAGHGEILREALREYGYLGDELLAQGESLLAALIRNTLNVRLPEGVRLADLADTARRSEMEFHFALGTVAVPRLLDLLHRHGLLIARQGFGLRDRLQGLMTGFIDLVYLHDDRAYLLDYKSNRLGDYTPQALAAAIATSEYDLQYLIYTVALHRWLRFRRADYDYDRHFGGVRYLFCRGLDCMRTESDGIYATRPPRELVEALDALFAPPIEVAA